MPSGACGKGRRCPLSGAPQVLAAPARRAVMPITHNCIAGDSAFPFLARRCDPAARDVARGSEIEVRFDAAAGTCLPAAPSAVPAAGAPLVLWLTGRGARDVLCQDLSAAAAAVVIELGCREGGRGDDYRDRGARLGDRACPRARRQLGAGRRRRSTCGRRAGRSSRGRRAQIRVAGGAHPSAGPADVLRSLSGAVRGHRRGPGHDRHRRRATGRRTRGYAAALREAGVDVRELVSDARRALPLHELARALQ